MTLTRRDFLSRMAALPLLPRLTDLGGIMQPGARSRSLILIWLDGGMTHVDTFDGKPESSPDIRGDLKSVKTPVEGEWISEHLPKLNPLMSRCALVRSITHGEGNHDRGTHFILTGHRPSQVLEYPAFGCTLALRQPQKDSPMPSYVCIPDAPLYAGPGFLSQTLSPFETGGFLGDPNYTVRDLTPREGQGKAIELLGKLDAMDGAPRSEDEAARDAFLAQARTLSLDPEARAMFDLAKEKPETRKRYGRHSMGQSCLLARRLVEGGTRVAIVRDRTWDHHVGIARLLTYGFPAKLTGLDEALSALIEDLDERGLSSRVTVCLASEFGRTPRLNPRGGRDHWPRAQSVLLFGAGIKRGVVVGETDPRAEEPVTTPLSPAHLVATLFQVLGVDTESELRTPDGRPIRLFDDNASPIAEVLAS